jgi:hypothetical protein
MNMAWISTLVGACLAASLIRAEPWKIPLACGSAVAIALSAPMLAGVNQPLIFQFLTAAVVMALIGGSFELAPRQIAGALSGAVLLAGPVLLWS